MPQSGFLPDNCLPYLVSGANKEEVSPLDGTAVFSRRLQEAAQSSVSFEEVVCALIFTSTAAIKTTSNMRHFPICLSGTNGKRLALV